MTNSGNTAQSDIAYIRLALTNEALRRVEGLPYPGEIQSCLKRRSSMIRLSELLYSVCGCEELPALTLEQPESQPLHSKEKAEPDILQSPETKALMDFFGKAGGNVLRSAASQAAKTGRVDSDTAKRAAVSGIAQTISLMMREERDK